MGAPWEKYQAAPAAAPADGPWAKYGADAAPADVPAQGHNILDALAALPGHIKEAITGDQRHTATTDALPDWATMPELNTFSMAGFKTGVGTLLSNPQETVQVIQSNFPGVKVSQDEKGNYLLQSSIDGKHYAIKPGFQASDIPRAIGGIAAFTPAGRAATIPGAAMAAAATQAAIEGTQAATGGEFNPGEVAMAGLFGGTIPAVGSAVRAVAAPAKQLLQRIRGLPDPAGMATAEATGAIPAQGDARAAAAAPDMANAAPAPAAPDLAAPAAPAVAPDAMAATDLAATARKAAADGLGSGRAKQVLAEQAAPDAKTVAAAQRLGIEDYLQPDHVTTNQAYRELAQAVKSIPGSNARAAELDGLQKVAQRANDLVDEIGGTHDASTLSSNVKSNLQSTYDQIKGKADDLYDQVRAAIPAKSEAPADNVLAMINARADELGGVKNLSPMERMVVAKLSPKTVKSTETVPGNPLMPGAQSASTRTVAALKQPTYALLDDVRRDLTAAKYSRQGPFKDSADRLITMLEGALRNDQQAAAEKFGMGATWDLAQKTAASYKGIQDDLSAIFGKNLDESLVGKLNGAVKLLPQGDTSKFVRLVKSVPEGMRQDVVASGLNTAFGKSAANGNVSFAKYAQWYEGLVKNKQSYTALMANLPPAARKQLSDLYRVSKGISAASKERIVTGRIKAIDEQLKGADSLVARLYDTAKRSALGAAVGTIATPVVGPGAAAAIASALTKGAKPSAVKAVDELINSPTFIALAKQGTQTPTRGGTLRLVHSHAFRKFAQAVGQSHDPSVAERWVRQAMQGNNQRQ